MPLYDHKCLDCSHEFEISYPASEIGKIKVKCEKCGGKTMKIIGGCPHVCLNWKLPSSRDDGHLRNTIHSARRNKPSPLDQNSGR